MYVWTLFFTRNRRIQVRSDSLGVSGWYLFWSNGLLDSDLDFSDLQCYCLG